MSSLSASAPEAHCSITHYIHRVFFIDEPPNPTPRPMVLDSEELLIKYPPLIKILIDKETRRGEIPLSVEFH